MLPNTTQGTAFSPTKAYIQPVTVASLLSEMHRPQILQVIEISLSWLRKKIQRVFKDPIGINVYLPAQCSGSTNNVISAGRFFSEPSKSAAIAK